MDHGEAGKASTDLMIVSSTALLRRRKDNESFKNKLPK